MSGSWQAPAHDQVGVRRAGWKMPDGDTIDGTYLALWSSQTKRLWSRSQGRWVTPKLIHEHSGPVVPPGGRCSLCRWFEMSLWRTDDDDQYVLVRHNLTEVADEEDRLQVARVNDPLDLADLPGLGPSHRPLQQLLEMAAEHDSRIAELGV